MSTADAIMPRVDAEPPLVAGGHDYASITETVCKITERPTTPRAWYIAFAIASSLTLMLFGLTGYLIATGVGVWGNNARCFGRGPSPISFSGSALVTPEH